MKDSGYLAFKKQPKLTDIDDGLNEGLNDANTNDESVNQNDVRRLKPKNNGVTNPVTDINPESFLTVKSKHLITAVPEDEFDELFDDGGEKVRNMNKMSLAEAFEDDDIVNDFMEEVDQAENGKKTNDKLSAQLPGWGSWGGVGVKIVERKKVHTERKIGNKERIIVNDYSNDKLKKHLVSSLPFPFTSVEAFESSIRNPVGRNYVPETVHNALVLPPVITKMGQVIEPMSEDALNNKSGDQSKFRKKGKGKRKTPFKARN